MKQMNLYKRLKKTLLHYLNRFHKGSNWLALARPNQLPPPGDWTTWIILAGRGFGKTRTGAETIRQWVKQKTACRIALIGTSAVEARRVMVEGESGLLSVHSKKEKPKYVAAQRQLVWPNGATATLFGGDFFEQLRGPQFDCAWIDEFAKFRYPKEAWEQLMLGLRLGKHPRCIVTTTPRPSSFLKSLLEAKDTVVTRGTTFDNQGNLAPSFFKQILKQFEGTRLAAQELYANMLTDTEGALWQREMIDYAQPPENADGTYNFVRIVIAIDPATTHHDQSDETGIVVAGLASSGVVYVLDDLSGRHSPGEWGKRVAEAFWKLKADRVVAEVNKGGDLVERIIKSHDAHIPVKTVRATRGKATRAEPIAALYEQRKVFHARPLKELETQLCTYVPGVTSKSPDRLDALVWALTELVLVDERSGALKVWGV